MRASAHPRLGYYRGPQGVEFYVDPEAAEDVHIPVSLHSLKLYSSSKMLLFSL